MSCCVGIIFSHGKLLVNVLYFIFFIFIHIPFGKFGQPYLWVRLQQPQEQCYPVLQVHAGTVHVSVIHQTLTWPTGSLAYVCDHSYAWVYTQGLGELKVTCSADSLSVYPTFSTRKNSHKVFLCSCRGSNLGSLDALPIEPPHHPT